MAAEISSGEPLQGLNEVSQKMQSQGLNDVKQKQQSQGEGVLKLICLKQQSLLRPTFRATLLLIFRAKIT